MSTSCPVRIRGVIFPSQKAAAKALGVSQASISQSLAYNGHCDNVGVRQARFNNENAHAVPVRIGQIDFRSQYAAAKALGVSRMIIRHYVSGTLKHQGIAKLIDAVVEYRRMNDVVWSQE